jgi:hypothetical protein
VAKACHRSNKFTKNISLLFIYNIVITINSLKNVTKLLTILFNNNNRAVNPSLFYHLRIHYGYL